MRMEPHPAEVRELVARTFQWLLSAPGAALDVYETILIDDGRYLGRSYRIDGYMAMWLVQIGIVQFYDAEGEMLHAINLFEESTASRAAA